MRRSAGSPATSAVRFPPPIQSSGSGSARYVAVVLLLAGLAFKVGAVPFHVWAPSTYQGASIPVAAYLSSVSKAGGIAGLIVVLAAVSAGSPAAATWIALLAAVSMTVGNLVAMRQRHLVRLLAWSGIAQTGYCSSDWPSCPAAPIRRSAAPGPPWPTWRCTS
ncbi:MAG: hypothetical protein M3381_05565 [Actinomycetota bacterium]|nr:hypothetical protein [Actinomycetota bacterium]